MHCPFCYYEDTRVIDSRLTEEGTMVRRRRECPCCDERFNTFETVELKLPMIIKSDKRREPFNKQKLRTSFERALQKRPVTSNALDKAMHEIIDALYRSSEREVSSRQVGERVMHTLKQLDQVAYVRFASVYRKFEDVRAFRNEIENLERELPWLET